MTAALKPVTLGLSNINQTLRSIRDDTLSIRKELSKSKKSLREEAIAKPSKSGPGPKAGAIEKPAATKAVKSASKAGGAIDWLKWFGILGLGVFMKDEIGGFLKGAFGSLGDMIGTWFKGTFVPGLAKLTDTIFGEGAWETLLGVGEDVKANLVKAWTAISDVGTYVDTKLKDWFGIDIGGIFTNIKTGLTQFGKDIGFLGEDGSLSTGAWFGVAAIGATFLKLGGPLGGVIKVFKGLVTLPFKALGLAVKGMIALVKAPFKLLGSAGRGLLGLVKGKVPDKVPKVPGAAKPTVASNFERGKGASAKQLDKAGLTRGKDGALTDKSGKSLKAGEISKRMDDAGVKQAKPSAPPKGTGKPSAAPKTGGGGGGAPKPTGGGEAGKIAKALTKFPRAAMALKFAKKIPMLGSLIGAGMIGMTLADDTMSKKEKTAKIAGALGGIGGATMGGFLGALGGGLVGAVGGPAAAITGFIGGVGGAVIGGMLGESLFEGLAQFMLGEKVTAFPEIWRPWPMDNLDVNAMFNQEDPKPTPKPKPPGADVKMGTKAGQIIGDPGQGGGGAMGGGGNIGSGGGMSSASPTGGGGGGSAIAPGSTATTSAAKSQMVDQRKTESEVRSANSEAPVVVPMSGGGGDSAPAPAPSSTEITNIALAPASQIPKDTHRRFAYGT